MLAWYFYFYELIICNAVPVGYAYKISRQLIGRDISSLPRKFGRVGRPGMLSVSRITVGPVLQLRNAQRGEGG